MEEFGDGRIDEQALEVGRPRLPDGDLDEMGGAVAAGELDEAQAIAMRVEAQRFGVDRHLCAEGQPLGQVALVQRDRHEQRNVVIRRA